MLTHIADFGLLCHNFTHRSSHTQHMEINSERIRQNETHVRSYWIGVRLTPAPEMTLPVVEIYHLSFGMAKLVKHWAQYNSQLDWIKKKINLLQPL